MERSSAGSFARLSENQTLNPWRTGRSSTTTRCAMWAEGRNAMVARSEEHTSELQSRGHLVCRLLLEKKNDNALLLLNLHLVPEARLRDLALLGVLLDSD